MDDFLWGVATAAYQVEGGINAAGEPLNNWAPWDRTGRVERCGEALGFWDDPDRLLDLAAAAGSNAFRLSVEWARVQPSPNPHETIAPDWDAAALDRYADILRRVRERGMEPVVTLHHFTHPLWCGRNFWVAADAPARFEGYVRRCVSELGRRLADAGQDPVRWWITINEPMVVPLLTYVLGMFPGTGRGLRRMARAYDHTLASHVRAYDAIHDVYDEQGWAPPMVSTNTISTTIVDLDAALVDIMLAREKRVERSDVLAYLGRCHDRARRRLAAVRREGPLAKAADVFSDRLARFASRFQPGAAIDALYSSPRERKLDYLSFDYYDPVFGHLFGWAPSDARRLRSNPVLGELWEQRVRPDGLAVFLRMAHLQAPDRPILLAENGMCTPGMRPRPDGEHRDDFLRGMVGEVLRARDEGVNVAGYIHWTIADNYEWGSYEPRFGLHGVDRSQGVEILPTDAVGVDAAAVFRELGQQARSGLSS